MSKKKNPNAVKLGKLRWKGIPKEERVLISKNLNLIKAEKLRKISTAEQAEGC